MSQPDQLLNTASNVMEGQDGPLGTVQPEDVPREQLIEKSTQHIAEQMWMAMRSGPSRDPFVEKMDGEHIHKVLDHSHVQEEHRLWAVTGMAILGVVAVFALCWLFLAYGKSEHVNAIIALVVGLLGGFGAGAGWQKIRSE